jgi:hypothetical protein
MATARPVLRRNHTQDHGRRSSYAGDLHGTTHGKDQTIKELFKEFDKYTKRKDSDAKQFICQQDLKEIWTINRIKSILSPNIPDDLTLDLIHRDMVIILSILVTISAPKDCLALFREQLFDPQTDSPRVTDTDIPLKEGSQHKIAFLSDAHQRMFMQEQHKFKPYIIRLRKFKYITEVDENERLPFEDVQNNIGRGTSGQVDRVRISPRYLRQADDSSYDHVR